jgi:hypothetical protein
MEGLIVFFLIVEPHGLAELWRSIKVEATPDRSVVSNGRI